MAMTEHDRPDLASRLEITRLSASLGAEVRGLDLAGVGPDEAATVRSLLGEHLVLFFPGQHLTRDEHLALGAHFGPMEGHPHLRNADGSDQLFELAASRGGIADEWHTDLTFQTEPSVMSILQMVECPEVGGDTMWSNLHDAYDALSPALREMIDGLTALHDALPHNRPDRMAIHPVVRRHPETGRKALYVNQHFTRRIVELQHQESEALLSLLTHWVTEDRFTVRYRWSAGTVAMWDNRCTQHHVVDDFEGERIIQRVTISGDRPEGEPPRWEPQVTRRGALSRFDRQLRRHLDDQATGDLG